MANDIPQWFRSAINTGLQGLVVLSLPRTPATDVITMTAGRWAQLLWKNRTWIEERDLPRLAIAFDQLAINSTEWPSPKQLATFLPAHARQEALPSPPATPEEKARQRRILTQMLMTVDSSTPVAANPSDRESAAQKPNMAPVIEQLEHIKTLDSELLNQMKDHPDIHPLVKAEIKSRLKLEARHE